MIDSSWRTRKISRWNNVQNEINQKSKQLREIEIEVAELKQRLMEIENSELPILLYVCRYKDNDSGRSDYDHLYYLPDLKMKKLERITRHIYIADENLLRPRTLDLRTAFKNCGFPEKISSNASDFWNLKQKNQTKVDKAISNLEATIDHFFACEEVQSWEYLRERLTTYYLPEKPAKSEETANTSKTHKPKKKK